MERKNYTVAVDLGSSNVVVAVGEKAAEGQMEVASIVSKPVEGVNAGKIENIELVSRAIREAMSEAEEQLGIRITEAYAGISGDFVRCARHTDHVFVYDPQNGVNQKDVDALFDRMRNVQAPDDETIMERVPQNYVVDDNQEVKNPVGSFGKKLSSTFNFILCLRTPMQRLDMALKRLGIKMLGVTSNAIATAEAVLLPDEKEEGVAVVDIGGGVTDVAVYYRNVVRYIATIPMGAMAINRDIRTMSVPEKHVESLKQKYGSAVADLAPEDKLIRVNGPRSEGHPAAQLGDGDRSPCHGHCGVRIAGNPGFGVCRQAGLRHCPDGRFGQAEGCGRVVPPRDGHGRAHRIGRNRRCGGVEGKGRRPGLCHGGRYFAQGRRTGCLRGDRASGLAGVPACGTPPGIPAPAAPGRTRVPSYAAVPAARTGAGFRGGTACVR